MKITVTPRLEDALVREARRIAAEMVGRLARCSPSTLKRSCARTETSTRPVGGPLLDFGRGWTCNGRRPGHEMNSRGSLLAKRNSNAQSPETCPYQKACTVRIH